MSLKYLIVEDSTKIREGICEFFNTKSQGQITIDQAGTGADGMKLIRSNTYDLVILDIMLPGVSGFELCKEVRKVNNCPVFFLTSLGSEESILKGYELGADDYIVKPFNVKELYAKTEAMVKRYRGNKDFEILKIDELELNTYTMQVFVDGNEVVLSPKEYFILKLLMENREKVFSRSDLIAKIWEYDFVGTDRVVDTQIKNLGRAGKHIATSFGRGYKINQRQNMRLKKSNVIKKPSFLLYLATFFGIILGTVLIVFLAFYDPIMDAIAECNSIAAMAKDERMELLDTVRICYRNDRTEEDLEKLRTQEVVSLCSCFSFRYEIDDETYTDTYKKIGLIYFGEYTDESRTIMFSSHPWDESKIDVYREISKYMNAENSTLHFYGARAQDIYYNPETQEVYPGKIALVKLNIFEILLQNQDPEEEEYEFVYDLTPDDTTNLVHVENPSCLFGISEESPVKPVDEYDDYLKGEWTPVKEYYDSNLSDKVTKQIYIVFATTAVLIILFMSVIFATIFYFYRRNIYNIFEYRKKTTNAMAHDLKTPLAIASLYVANLKENLNDPEKSSKHADEIDDSISYMNKLVNNILEFSNSESDSAISKEELDIRTQINSHLSSVEANIKSRGIKFTISGDAKIITDKKLWNQAISNLIDNAIKYASGPVIEINISNKEVSVINNVETDISNVSNLKEPFVKGDSERGENTGSGLGLSIADNNLKRLGYRLDVNCADKKFIAKIKM